MGTFDEWRVVLAPLPRLVGAYYRGDLSWEMFESQYLKFLRYPETEKRVIELANLALENTVTVMCVEPSPEMCHRRLLAEQAQLLVPGLQIDVR